MELLMVMMIILQIYKFLREKKTAPKTKEELDKNGPIHLRYRILT